MNKSHTPITLLPEALQNQIAAGEVVERPASIIKELIENSLDANATTIEVFIENGGHTFVQVRDNGFGIPPNELRLALTRHATSKIKTMTDIWKIQSFGFRGEALPSIASVSSFKIESAYTIENNTEAAFIQVEHGKIAKEGPSSLYRGTIITVQDLFATVPARLKFLKTPSTEQKRAQDLFARLALTNIAEMILYSGTREVLKFSSDLSLHERLKIIWPDSITSNLLPFDNTIHNIRVHGFTSPPNQTQPRSDRIFLYVNGRTVNDKLLLRAIQDAYKGRLISKEYPQSVLFIEISPELIDVNVHPAKTEIRFHDEKAIFSAVINTLKNSLTTLIPNFSIHQENQDPIEIHPKGFWGKADLQQIFPVENNTKQSDTVFIQEMMPNTQHSSIPSQMYSSPIHETIEKNKNYSIFQNKYEPTDNVVKTYSPSTDTVLNTISSNEPETLETSLSKTANEIHIQQLNGQMHIGPYIYMGQVGDTYLVLIDSRKKNDNAELIILDQHAVHERILTEKLREGTLLQQAQALILPIQLTLHPTEKEHLEKIRNLLTSLGFSFSLKDATLEVQTIPPLLDRSLATTFLRKALAGQQENLEKLWVSMACKSAIKSGLSLPPNEAAALIKQWIHIDQREYCPHGRPCVLIWTTNELHKLFKRKK